MLKKVAIFLVITLILVASISPAVASGLNSDGALVAADEDSPVAATITKHLQLPIGTTTPNISFQFQAEKISVDGRTTEADLDTMPALNAAALSVAFTAADTDPTVPPALIMTISKETGNLFAGVTFPHAGVFVYEIREIADSNAPAFPDEHSLLYYSQAVYTLTVYVANHSNGGTYVHAVGTLITTDDLGEPGSGKVDPTPGGNGEDYFFSQMAFTNDYVKTEGPTDPEKPDPVNESTLLVSKTVGGDFGDRSQFFTFDMTLTVPALVRDVPAYYRAYVLEGDTVLTDLTAHAEASVIGGTEDMPYLKIATDGTTTFELKHGQRLVFVDTPVGTSYIVEEAATTHYVPSVVITTGGTTEISMTAAISEKLSTETQFVGESDNSAAFTNTRDSVTPTGLNLNDVPFIIMIILAAGALVTAAVIKVRKGKRHSH